MTTPKAAIFGPQSPTPRELGFAMPPEWEQHAATWMSWPADNDLWWGHLEDVRDEYARLVATIARFEPVELLVRDEESENDAKERLGILGVHNLRMHRVPLDDSWLRDNGPLWVRNADGKVALVNWRFNAWGNKFDWENDNNIPDFIAETLGFAQWQRPEVMEGGALEIGPDGVALVTRSCLLTPTRNPELDEEGNAELLKETLGFQKLVWLEGGLENDHTDGHIDTVTRWANPKAIVTSVADENTDPTNAAAMNANKVALQQAIAEIPELAEVELIELPLPANRLEGAEGRLPPTYANFYIGNGFVVVPQYDDPNDEKALEILRPLFPKREVIGLASRAIIEGGGSFHCLTQQQPIGSIWQPEE